MLHTLASPIVGHEAYIYLKDKFKVTKRNIGWASSGAMHAQVKVEL